MALGGGGGGSGKWGGHGHGAHGHSNRGRPYGLMLLLALGAAIFGVMVLHKFRESRIFNLLIQDKDRHILSLHLLLQKERDATKEVKRKVEELKAKANSLRMQKAELNNKLLDMQSVTSSLKEENKVLESAFAEKQNEIKMLREREMESSREKQNEMNLHKDKDMDSSKDASQVTVLTDLLKQKEAEIEDLKGRLEKPTKIWSVSTDDPSNPPVNFSRNGELSNVDNRVVEVGGQDDQSEDHADHITESNQNGEVVRGKGDVENSRGSESFSGERVTGNTTEMSATSFTDGTMKAEEGSENVAFGGKEDGKSTDNTPPGKLDKSQDGRSQTILGSRVKGNYGHKHVTKTKRRKIISKDKTGNSTVGLGRVTTRGGESADSDNPHYHQNNDTTNKQGTSELNKPGEGSVNKLDNSRYVGGSKGEGKGVVTEEDEERESEAKKREIEAASMTSESTNVVSNHQERKDDGLVTEEKQLGGTRSNLSSNSIGIRIGNQANEVIGQAEDQEAKMISANQYKDTNGDENPAEGMRVAYNPKKEVDGNHETSGAA